MITHWALRDFGSNAPDSLPNGTKATGTLRVLHLASTVSRPDMLSDSFWNVRISGVQNLPAKIRHDEVEAIADRSGIFPFLSAHADNKIGSVKD